MVHKRPKHITIKYHWVRKDLELEEELKTAPLMHVRTGDNSADNYTNTLTGPVFMGYRGRNLDEEWKSAVAVERRSIAGSGVARVGFFTTLLSPIVQGCAYFFPCKNT